MPANRITVGLSLQVEDKIDIDDEAAKLGLGRSAYLVLCHKQRKYISKQTNMVIPVLENRKPKPRQQRSDKGVKRGKRSKD